MRDIWHAANLRFNVNLLSTNIIICCTISSKSIRVDYLSSLAEADG